MRENISNNDNSYHFLWLECVTEQVNITELLDHVQKLKWSPEYGKEQHRMLQLRKMATCFLLFFGKKKPSFVVVVVIVLKKMAAELLQLRSLGPTCIICKQTCHFLDKSLGSVLCEPWRIILNSH